MIARNAGLGGRRFDLVSLVQQPLSTHPRQSGAHSTTHHTHTHTFTPKDCAMCTLHIIHAHTAHTHAHTADTRFLLLC